jgi:hypothetical protein
MCVPTTVKNPAVDSIIDTWRRCCGYKHQALFLIENNSRCSRFGPPNLKIHVTSLKKRSNMTCFIFTYMVAIFGWLGRGKRIPPKACLVELAHAKWPECSASDYVSYHDRATTDTMVDGGQSGPNQKMKVDAGELPDDGGPWPNQKTMAAAVAAIYADVVEVTDDGGP